MSDCPRGFGSQMKKVARFVIIVVTALALAVGMAWADSLIARRGVLFDATVIFDPPGSDELDTAGLEVRIDDEVGWPAAMLSRLEWMNENGDVVKAGGTFYFDISDRADAWLPVHIIWTGFVLNVLVYAGALYGCGRLVAVVRKRGRMRAGTCPGCGYDLRETPTRCPECGWQRARSTGPGESGEVAQGVMLP